MSKVLNFPAVQAKGRYFSYVEHAFNAVFEQKMRLLGLDPNPQKEAQNLPQDELLYIFNTVGSTTGQALEIGWKSGRRDVHIIVDLPAEMVTAEKIAQRASEIAQLKEVYHDKGFEHGGSADPDRYEGGFGEFAQNFERATGHRATEAISALCERERELIAARVSAKVAG